MSEIKESEVVVVPTQPKNLLNESLFAVKNLLKPVLKGKANPFFKSKYADLNAILSHVEPLLLENDLILLQSTKTSGQSGNNFVVTSLTHRISKETVESSLSLPQLSDMQKLGSAITYGRRYTLSSLLGLQTEDDDGNLASKPKKKAVTKEAVSTNDDF